jgi:acryloyl-coenzyme A reductase
MLECVRLNHVGWDEPLEYVCEPGEPEAPAGDQVLIEVAACGVAHRDLIDRSGRVPFIQTPIVQGHEAAGRVVAVGSEVGRWRVGDRVATMHRDSCGRCAMCERDEVSLCSFGVWVFGLMVDGGYARYLLAPERALFAIPDSVSLDEAAILHSTFGTAYRGLHQFGPLTQGDRVLVTGANGGVGNAGVQIAKRLGAHVTAVVRDDEHREFVAGLGADVVLVNPGQSIHKALGATRVDLVLECVGSPVFPSALRSLRLGGGIVSIGNVEDSRVAVNLGYLIVQALRVVGSSGASEMDMKGLLALHEEKPFEIAIDRRLDLRHAEQAHQLVKNGGLRGRVVLVPGLDQAREVR